MLEHAHRLDRAVPSEVAYGFGNECGSSAGSIVHLENGWSSGRGSVGGRLFVLVVDGCLS